MARVLETCASASAALAVLLGFCASAQAELPAWKCGDDADCADPSAPYCDPDSGDCYPCVLDEHCEPGDICHQHICIPPCFDDADCTAPTDHCSPDGLCLECLEDAHCPGEEPLCLIAPGVGACVECIVDEDCPETQAWCKPGFYSCEECAAHLDCPEDQHCVQDSCVPDTCVPGALSCSEDQMWVLECDEFGAGEKAQQECPDADCEDGACGGTTGGGTTGGGTEAGEDDTGLTSGGSDAGATPVPRDGCGCSLERGGAPVGALGLFLLALFGVRPSRRRS